MSKCTCNAKVLDEQWHHYGCPHRCSGEIPEKPNTVTYQTLHGTHEADTLDEAKRLAEGVMEYPGFEIDPEPLPEQPREGARVKCALCNGTHFYKQPMAGCLARSANAVNTICPYCGPPTNDTDEPAQPQPRGEGDLACTECLRKSWGSEKGESCGALQFDGSRCRGTFQAEQGEGDDLAARTVQIIRNRAKIAREQGTTEAQIIRARALDEAANEFADILPALRASTHPEQWVSGDDREWLLWITSYVLNRHEFTDSAATDARAALTRIATAIKQPASPTPTEQGEDRTRVEWHDGIEHGDELALRQLAATIGCGVPYGCQPSVGKWYAAALDRVLDRLLPLDPAPEQGEARVLREGEIADHADAGGRFLYDCPKHGLIEDGWVGSFRCEDDNEGDIMYCTLCPASREWAKDELKGPFAFPPAQTEQGEARVEYRIRISGRFPTAAMPLDQVQRLARDGDVIECRTLTDWTALEPAPEGEGEQLAGPLGPGYIGPTPPELRKPAPEKNDLQTRLELEAERWDAADMNAGSPFADLAALLREAATQIQKPEGEGEAS